MHEMSVATNILDLAEKSMEGYRELRSVTVQIGELAGIETESLRFSFEALRKSTPYPDVQLVIEEVRGRGVCESCGREVHMDEPFALCPECGTYSVRITRGQELKLLSIEVD